MERKVTDQQFEMWVTEGIGALPDWVRERIVNVAFIVRGKPSTRVRKEECLMENETLFGLYHGVPLAERGDESPLMPDTITIFKEPILETYDTEEEIRTCISNTIWHEVAHYFGHGEEWVAEEEKRRGMEK